MKLILLIIFLLIAKIGFSQQTSDSVRIINDSVRIINGDSVYTSVDKRPAFRGGPEGLSNYIGHHIDNVPTNTPNGATTGVSRLLVKFMVRKDGKVTNVSIIGNQMGDAMNQRIIETMQNCRGYKPALVNGKPVNYIIIQPILFNIQ
jgi:TonB-like protein